MTRTPLRVSFAGGGTDLADFYERESGAVFSTAIDKYIYVTVKRHGTIFNESIRLNYSKSEQFRRSMKSRTTSRASACGFSRSNRRFISAPLLICRLHRVWVDRAALPLGLLNALHAFRGERVSAGQLAEEACHIEIDVSSSRSANRINTRPPSGV